MLTLTQTLTLPYDCKDVSYVMWSVMNEVQTHVEMNSMLSRATF